MRLTFRIVGLTLFSTDVEDAADEIGRALGYLLAWTNERSARLVQVPLWIPTPANVRFARAKKTFDDLIYAIIRERKAGTPKGDLLDMLLAADAMPEQQLRDELITLAAAGHETTANALSWTFYLLSKHPDVERRVRAEVEEVLGDRPPSLDDLPKLAFTERVIEESMRLYPPVWALERQAVGEDIVGGERVRPGTIVMMSPYAMHRDPELWENPEGFDPDRFLPDAKKARPRYAYIPFGGGPRICIGNAFAMMEAKIVLALAVRKFRLELIPGQRVEMDPSITLRPKNGVLALPKVTRSGSRSEAPPSSPPAPSVEAPAELALRSEPGTCPYRTRLAPEG
jgi:cytochrome P450